MSVVRWWLFSDLHYGKDEPRTGERDAVMTAFWVDVDTQLASGKAPDFIIVSGDIANRGLPSEYEQAENSLFRRLSKVTKVDRSRFFFVPGNHDIDRSAITSIESTILTTIRQASTLEDINAILNSDRSRHACLTPFANFESFVTRWRGKPIGSGHDWACAYSERIDIRGSVINIVGMNTALRCGYFEKLSVPNANNPVSALPLDKQLLILGEPQLLASEATADNVDATIVVFHHPLDWLVEDARTRLAHQLRQRGEIWHFGHEHSPYCMDEIGSEGDKLFHGAAPQFFGERNSDSWYANGYAILELDTSTRRLTVRLQRYEDAPTPKWIPNHRAWNGYDGVREFTLRQTVQQKANQLCDRSAKSDSNLDRQQSSCSHIAAVVNRRATAGILSRSTALTRCFKRICTIVVFLSVVGAGWWFGRRPPDDGNAIIIERNHLDLVEEHIALGGTRLEELQSRYDGEVVRIEFSSPCGDASEGCLLNRLGDNKAYLIGDSVPIVIWPVKYVPEFFVPRSASLYATGQMRVLRYEYHLNDAEVHWTK